MSIQVPPPRTLPVWDCHICGAPEAFTGHPDHCASVPGSDGLWYHGLYHDDGTLCRWESTDSAGRQNVRAFIWDRFEGLRYH